MGILTVVAGALVTGIGLAVTPFCPPAGISIAAAGKGVMIAGAVSGPATP